MVNSFNVTTPRLTMNETIAYLLGLSPVENKELCARFDGGRLSSDGGVLVLWIELDTVPAWPAKT